jgi:hypothetical protein
VFVKVMHFFNSFCGHYNIGGSLKPFLFVYYCDRLRWAMVKMKLKDFGIMVVDCNICLFFLFKLLETGI